MGLKCSLLGHKFSDTTVEEDREEQGSEVLTTVRELEHCERCGETRVVSENKEVTSVASATADAGEDDTAEADPAGEPSPAPDMNAVEDDAELITEAQPDTAGEEDAGADGDVDVDEPASPEEDDAVILEDSSDDRSPGEWPDDEEPPAEKAAAEDASVDDEPGDSSGESTGEADEWPDVYGHEDDGGDGTDVDWPEEDTADEEWVPAESLTEAIDDRTIEPADGATVTVPEGEFACPECGFATPVEESSLRAGDFCPECRRGTLAHRTDGETRKE